MTLAEELAEKYRFSMKYGFGDAINEALERAAQEADKEADDVPLTWKHAAETIAHRIRSLKSEPSKSTENAASDKICR